MNYQEEPTNIDKDISERKEVLHSLLTFTSIDEKLICCIYTKAIAVPTSSKKLTICFCWRLKESTLIPLKVEFYGISMLSTDINTYICEAKAAR